MASSFDKILSRSDVSNKRYRGKIYSNGSIVRKEVGGYRAKDITVWEMPEFYKKFKRSR